MNPSATAQLPVFPLASDAPGKSSQAIANDFSEPAGEDETLLRGVARGNRDSLEQLFRIYAPQLRGIGKRLLQDYAEADDLVQEVFLYIYRKSSLFDVTRGSARSWIIQVAYSQALIRRRRLKSLGFFKSGIMDNSVENLCTSVESTNYIDTIEGLFGTRGWNTVWSSLTEFQQETFRLHFYEGCNFNEIAEKLGQSYVNIRHHYYRGLEKLRKHAEDNGLRWP